MTAISQAPNELTLDASTPVATCPFAGVQIEARWHGKLRRAKPPWDRVCMTAGVTGGGLYYQKSESAMASEGGINNASEHANWGGEFVDDALRARG